ncbi:juvenile hormone epoxide hydrolase-like [Zerene cesonia]|uniref:juvenile hormone epoxide hydrolase-like n=1 Tax=Zerene cesonia TaxID=33412 RepID=UPI0018E590F6|nr:juvenile hormone epoxide hydrolase-like [Zerene cesonia]XP_038218169.1 juvenile hormone epoxide hydrolase-like [Zerene cesonia]
MLRLILLSALAGVAAPILYFYFQSPPPLPDIDLEEWWGPKLAKSKYNDSIVPFQVDFSNLIVKDIKDRLRDRHPLTPPLEGIAFEYGFNSKQLESWLKYWAEEYPFSAREKYMNQYKHYKTNIQGLNIHFVRVTPEVPAGKEVVPLLLLHGWPGSFLEFYDAIPLLTAVNKDSDFAVELIIPSLPGYGFSSAAVRPGLGADKVAVVMRNLMSRLGYKKYYIQGGDWGAIITSIMTTFFPNEVLGYHTNIAFLMTHRWASIVRVLGSIYPPLVVGSDVADRMYPLGEHFSYLTEESGYLHIQATKPDTIGVALADTPAGLAAYILEKFSTWTKPEYRSQPDGGLTQRFPKEKLIDNVMVYWVTNSITSSMRLYSETFNKRFLGLGLDQIPTPVPTSVMQAKNELAFEPEWILKTKYPNLLQATVLDDGGHFLAMELPDEFAKDVLNAIAKFRNWHRQYSRSEL